MREKKREFKKVNRKKGKNTVVALIKCMKFVE